MWFRLSKQVLTVVLTAILGTGVTAQRQRLTPEQNAAVESAMRKILTISQSWSDDDPRWVALNALVAGLAPPCASCAGQPYSPPILIHNDSLPPEYYAVTRPRNRRLKADDLNDIDLNGSHWGGPANDRFLCPDSALAACYFLAGVLIHEGGHQGDDYAWPPTLPGDRTKWHCAEIDAACYESDLLTEALDDSNLTPSEVDKINERRAALAALKRQHQTLKNG